MNFFIQNAIAETNFSSQQEGTTSLILILIISGLIIYFMILRPQQKKNKEHEKMIASIIKGDEVMTNGGLIGRVIKISDNGYITISLNEVTEVIIKNNFIAAILPKGTIKRL